MSRNLAVFLPVPSTELVAVEDVLLDDPGRWLAAARPAGPSIWRTTLTFGPVEREIACRVGDLRDEPGALWRDVTWNPVSQARDRVPVHELLPHFEGELGLHRNHAVLVLSGRYAVPGGRLGELVDAVALGGAARATANGFLKQIAAQARHAPVG